MSFNSLQYFAFFVVVLLIYYRLGLKGQNRLVVVAGSVFYGAFDWRFLFLLYASIAVDYSVGRGLGSADSPKARKGLLAVSLVFQLGILGFFKYFDFFSRSVSNVFLLAGLHVDTFTLHILLPVGISFYTFQTLAYIFAVYRRQVEPERNLITFATFVCWFPQLVAGPIERAPSLLPQIQRRRNRPDNATIESGVMLIVRGLLKKVVIADSVAAYVNTVYQAPYTYRWSTLIVATVGFAVQVYGDFSGYTDIARGSSRLLGVELRRNFEQPFLSRDMREFWQRWHISLASWFVDFVGGPLGAASKGRRRATINVLIIFALIGLWHGAAWTFVFWGVLNGLFVVWYRRKPVPKGRHPMKVKVSEIPSIVWTFVLFCFGVVFFRALNIHDALRVIKHIVLFKPGLPGPSGAVLVPIMLALVLVLDVAERRNRIASIERYRIKARLGAVCRPDEAVAESPTFGWPNVGAGVLAGCMLLAVVGFSGGTPTPFIYFKF